MGAHLNHLQVSWYKIRSGRQINFSLYFWKYLSMYILNIHDDKWIFKYICEHILSINPNPEFHTMHATSVIICYPINLTRSSWNFTHLKYSSMPSSQKSTLLKWMNLTIVYIGQRSPNVATSLKVVKFVDPWHRLSTSGCSVSSIYLAVNPLTQWDYILLHIKMIRHFVTTLNLFSVS